MENLDFNTIETTRRDDSVVATLMRNVYIWMTLALVITGLTAFVTAHSAALLSILFSSKISLFLVILAELGLVMYLSARIDKMSFTTATLMFILYSVVNGLTLSVIFLVYSISAITTTFFATAGTFASMAIIGSVTKKDLSGFGKFFLMSIIGLIIASVVNIFMGNAMLDLIISGVGVVIFAGLTAYDSQKIRQMLATMDDVDDSSMKLALIGSLSLYLDFINLFLYLLRIFGRRD